MTKIFLLSTILMLDSYALAMGVPGQAQRVPAVFTKEYVVTPVERLPDEPAPAPAQDSESDARQVKAPLLHQTSLETIDLGVPRPNRATNPLQNWSWFGNTKNERVCRGVIYGVCACGLVAVVTCSIVQIVNQRTARKRLLKGVERHG